MSEHIGTWQFPHIGGPQYTQTRTYSGGPEHDLLISGNLQAPERIETYPLAGVSEDAAALIFNSSSWCCSAQGLLFKVPINQNQMTKEHGT